MRMYLASLLLLCACSGSHSTDTLTFHVNEPVTGIEIRAVNGSVHVLTREGDGVHLEAKGRYEGSATEPPTFAEHLKYEVRDGVMVVTNSSPEKDWVVDLSITAPPGLHLMVSAHDASVRVDGTVAGGSIKTGRGDITLNSPGAPTSDLSCTSLSGDIRVAVSRTFHGGVHLQGRANKISVTPHPALFQKWDPERRSMTGFVGEKPALAERQKQLTGRSDTPPGIWARAHSGAIAFHLLD